MTIARLLLAIAAGCALLTGCAGPAGEGVDVAIIGDPGDLDTAGNRLGLAAGLVRSATSQGLVRLDETGDLVPGLAERWIVTADGLSYIFRIRPLDLPGGDRLTARTVQRALSRTIAGLKGTSLGLDLAKVRDVRAMTGRVIEIRLDSPLPGMLQLLAQPELGIALDELATGPMTLQRTPGGALLGVLPPQARGLPEQPDWSEGVEPVRVSVQSARDAVRGFAEGRYALVLGGTLATLPMVDTGPLSRGTVRLDSALGLFGLDVLTETGFLADPRNREALAMALDRAALIAPFNLSGWTPTTRVVAPGLPDDPAPLAERWADLTLESRRAEAARRVARWASAAGVELALTVQLPDGPGSDILFTGLAEQYATIGIALARAPDGSRADLALRDRVARFADRRWFLNQFNCRFSKTVCSPDVDFLVQLSVDTLNGPERAGYLAEAETALETYNAFIPIGAPIRWSLVRSGVRGFAENAWAIHPLFPLARSPI